MSLEENSTVCGSGLSFSLLWPKSWSFKSLYMCFPSGCWIAIYLSEILASQFLFAAATLGWLEMDKFLFFFPPCILFTFCSYSWWEDQSDTSTVTSITWIYTVKKQTRKSPLLHTFAVPLSLVVTIAVVYVNTYICDCYEW